MLNSPPFRPNIRQALVRTPTVQAQDTRVPVFIQPIMSKPNPPSPVPTITFVSFRLVKRPGMPPLPLISFSDVTLICTSRSTWMCMSVPWGGGWIAPCPSGSQALMVRYLVLMFPCITIFVLILFSPCADIELALKYGEILDFVSL